MPRDVLDEAKDDARRHNTTLTRLVPAFLRQLGKSEMLLTDAPIAQRLSGVLSKEASIEDYHLYWEENHDARPV
jgi:hypothetical protein